MLIYNEIVIAGAFNTLLQSVVVQAPAQVLARHLSAQTCSKCAITMISTFYVQLGAESTRAKLNVRIKNFDERLVAFGKPGFDGTDAAQSLLPV